MSHLNLFFSPITGSLEAVVTLLSCVTCPPWRTNRNKSYQKLPIFTKSYKGQHGKSYQELPIFTKITNIEREEKNDNKEKIKVIFTKSYLELLIVYKSYQYLAKTTKNIQKVTKEFQGKSCLERVASKELHKVKNIN